MWSQWGQRHFAGVPTTATLPAADADADGFDNHTEWAFGTSPLDSLARPAAEPVLVRLNPGEPARLALVVHLNPLATLAPAPDTSWLELTLQASPDLRAWRDIPAGEIELITSPGRRMFVLPAAADATAFARLRIRFGE